MTDTVQPKPPTGDFYAPINRYKTPGDSKPMFKGHITKPGTDAKMPAVLWSFKYIDKATGEELLGFRGTLDGVSTDLPAMEQIEALMAAEATDVTVGGKVNLKPGQVVLFHNQFKAEAPEKNRPDHRGWVNPFDGSEPFQISSWTKTFEVGGAVYLSGKTQYPIPGTSQAELQDGMADLEALKEAGAVTQGMPADRKKARGGR